MIRLPQEQPSTDSQLKYVLEFAYAHGPPVGSVIVSAGLFIAVWAAAISYWRLARIEDRWASAAGTVRVPSDMRDQEMVAPRRSR